MKYITIVLLMSVSAFFSAAEMAFASVNKIRLKHLAANGSKGAARALKISEKYTKAITVILVGNNIVNILAASLGTVIFTDIMGDTGVAVSTVVITLLVLIFGEITPKAYAKQNAEKVTIVTGGLLNFFILILTPVAAVFIFIQNGVLRLFKSDGKSPSVTEDELKYIIDEIEDEGVLEEKESDLVRSALEFDETSIEQILVPRVKVTAVEKGDSIEKIMRIFIEQRYSRLPVYDKSIDNIIGILHEKDFFSLVTQSEQQPASIESIIQKAIYVSEIKLISEVLYEMQRTKIHMAIVKDQYGGTSGIVTLEDIIEELVGEIYDENDEIIPSIIKLGDNVYEIKGELNLDDFAEAIGLTEDFIESDSITVSGFVLELFGCIPEINDTIEKDIFKITILEADEQHVGKIGLVVKPEADKSPKTEAE